MAAVMAIVNVWVGVRLDALLAESSIDSVLDLERRVASFPHKSAVKLLIFGNSHAVAGLRPPMIAQAVGLRPDEVFSLALPGGSVREMRLLAERHLASFPAANRAVVSVDEYFLANHIELRHRYLTRGSIVERWRYASSVPKLDDRLGLMAGLLFPLADFASPLRGAAVARPTLTARRLFVDVPSPPDSFQGRIAALNYPWGYPPPWDDSQLRRQVTLDVNLSNRAFHLKGNATELSTGLGELERLARSLEAHGARPMFLEMPYVQPLTALLAQDTSYRRKYKEPLQAYLRAAGRAIVPAPAVSARHFYDLDHLNPEGAELMAGWLKKRLVGQTDVRIGGQP